MKLNTKDAAFGALLLSLLLVSTPVLCNEDNDADVKQHKAESDSNPLGLEGINLEASGTKKSPAALPGHSTSTSDSSSKIVEEKEAENESEDLTKDNNNGKEFGSDESKKGLHNTVEFRSNSSSVSVESGFVPSKHFLFADRPVESAAGAAVLSERNTNNSTHVEKHQLHQSSEDDEELDGLKPPPVIKEDESQINVADSGIVGSGSVPVRAGSKVNIRNNNGSAGVNIRKPIPIIRQDAANKDEHSDQISF